MSDVPAGAAQPDVLGADVETVREALILNGYPEPDTDPCPVAALARLVASHEQLRARLAGQSDPATLRAGLEAIKADMSREAFVPWAEGMLAALDSTQAALERERALAVAGGRAADGLRRGAEDLYDETFRGRLLRQGLSTDEMADFVELVEERVALARAAVEAYDAETGGEA